VANPERRDAIDYAGFTEQRPALGRLAPKGLVGDTIRISVQVGVFASVSVGENMHLGPQNVTYTWLESCLALLRRHVDGKRLATFPVSYL
jgi:hypothetical protein